MSKTWDVVIIGGGVSGCAVAYSLAKYDLSVCVLERAEDVCCGTSKANSAIVHAGFDAQPGSRMAPLNVRGNAMMDQLAKDLDVPFKRIGAMVCCLHEEDEPHLRELYERGVKNGVPKLSILSAEEARKLEPNLSDRVTSVLLAETSGIVCPFELTMGMAENAAANGTAFFFDEEVTDITRQEEGYEVKTASGTYRTKVVVNAAGVYADKIHHMVSEDPLSITPRKGEYMLLDKTAGTHVGHTIFMLPDEMGKGVLVTPTVHGNLIVGPTSKDIPDKEGTNTTAEGMAAVTQKSALTVKDVPLRQVITSFAGLRAHREETDFLIGEPSDAPGFIDCAGIESPGLSAAPAVGEEIAEMVKGMLSPALREGHVKTRKPVVRCAEMSMEERNALIQKDPAYGNIVCRCEGVTEGEIRDAIQRVPGARSLDGVKRRTRAGMGRCQSGFCSPKTMKILAELLEKYSLQDITKSGKGSEILIRDGEET